jgi:hypothetical protein
VTIEKTRPFDFLPQQFMLLILQSSAGPTRMAITCLRAWALCRSGTGRPRSCSTSTLPGRLPIRKKFGQITQNGAQKEDHFKSFHRNNLICFHCQDCQFTTIYSFYFIQCCGSGSALIWLSWIRIRIRKADPDPASRKLTKINLKT